MSELISSTPEWQALIEHHQRLSTTTIAQLLNDPDRVTQLTLETGGVMVDCSRNRVDGAAISALLALGQRAGLSDRVKDYFSGASVNTSEDRPALHWLFRDPKNEFSLDGADLMPEVRETLKRMGAFCSAVRTGAYRGASGERIADVVNVGIGGSDAGPRLATAALSQLASDVPRMHFLDNVDGHGMDALLGQLHPAHTLCIITSKSFTTPETLRNAQTLQEWLGAEAVTRQMVAVTGDKDAARALGIADAGIFPLPAWVGGRYSLWSAVGLAVGIALGMEVFHELLEGGRFMDEHFQTATGEENLPVMLGLLDIWHRNIGDYPTQATVVYDDRLSDLVTWQQQLVMESLGKSVTRDGTRVDYPTSTVVWGGTGTPAEHTFFQALHQGTDTVPLDLIGVIEADHDHRQHHEMLLAHLLGQAAALTHGHESEDPHARVPGNRPSTVILLDQLSPRSLGALLALQEHRMFVRAAVLDVNPFDQSGVELGKRMAADIESGGLQGLDPSMDALLKRVKKS